MTGFGDPKEAEAAKFWAEAQHFAALASKEELLVERTELEVAKLRYEREVAEANDHDRHRVLHFETAVSSTEKHRNVLDTWHRLDPEAPWTIVWNSPGGSVFDGMALFDHITTYSRRGGGTHHITMKVRGMAASMAGILLQAGDTRVCGRESMILIHKISTMTGGSVDDIEDELKLLNKMCDRVVQIFVERSEGKLTTRQIKKNWTKTDWWLTSDDALELGIVDEIG